MSNSDALQPQADNSIPRYRSYGWEQWPEHAWLSYQFRRTLGYAQLGGASVSECMQVASRVVPADKESWHAEWMRVADRNSVRAEQAEKAGDIFTARAAWLRASSYYRSAEFRLADEETGADHCQHDNPALGSDIAVDWLAHHLGINQAELVSG